MKILQKNGLPHPYIMLLLAPLLWASSNVTGKLSKSWLNPYELTFYRWLLATLILTFAARHIIARDWQTLKDRAFWLLVVGGSGFGLFNIVLYSAYAHGAKVINVSIITALIPLGVVACNRLIFKNKIHSLQWLGVGLAFFGVLWLMTRGQPLEIAGYHFAKGDAIALGCTAIYIAYTVALRFAPQVHWASLLWAMCFAGLIVATPFYFISVQNDALHPITWRVVVLVIYVAIAISIISKLFYMESVIQIGGDRAALAMNLLPIFGAILGVLFFADEKMTLNHYIALSLVMAGIFCSECGAHLQKVKA